MTCLSVQTVNMCSKYLNVISRKSESLISVTIESSLARHPVSSKDDDFPAAQYEGGRITSPSRDMMVTSQN